MVFPQGYLSRSSQASFGVLQKRRLVSLTSIVWCTSKASFGLHHKHLVENFNK